LHLIEETKMFIDPSTQKWLRRNGVHVDANGVPKFQTLSGEPENCWLCGRLAEMPAYLTVVYSGVDLPLLVCADCGRLAFTDNAAFWRRLHAKIQESP
jgi:hypothetical protein